MACNVLTVVDTQVLAGNVTFLAGEAVVLGEDFIAVFSGLVADSTDVPIPILDLSTVMSTIDVTDSLSIADVAVTLDLEHTFDAELGP